MLLPTHGSLLTFTHRKMADSFTQGEAKGKHQHFIVMQVWGFFRHVFMKFSVFSVVNTSEERIIFRVD